MGLPMYVSPSPSKRQLPSKQYSSPTTPPYTHTPQAEEDLAEETYQNSRTSAFDIPEHQPDLPQRSQRSRRSTSLPYNLVQQHIQRLHQLHQLHRTREQQISSSNLASRRGLNSSHHLSLSHRAQQVQAAQARRQDRNLVGENIFEPPRNTREERLDDSHDEIIDFASFDDFVSSLDNNNNNSNSNNNNSRSNLGIGLVDGVQRNNNINNDNDSNNRSNHHSSSAALDNVIRRVNLLRQISQQQESRMMRSSSRHHRSSTGHSSSGRSSRTTSSQNVNVDRRRDDLIQRGIDIHPSSTIRHSGLPEPTLLFANEHNAPPLPSVQRLSAWHTRRGVNWPTDPQSQQRSERRSSFVDDFYSTSDSPDGDHHHNHMSRILSPIPRRYDARFAATLTSLPIGDEHELLGNHNNNIDNRSNVDRISSSNEPVRTEQRGSASGEVC